MHQIRFTTLSRVSMPRNIYCDFDLICNYALAMQRKQLLSYSWLYKLHTCVVESHKTILSGFSWWHHETKHIFVHILGWNGNGNGAGCDICHIFLRINSLREFELTQYFVFELYNKAYHHLYVDVTINYECYEYMYTYFLMQCFNELMKSRHFS